MRVFASIFSALLLLSIPACKKAGGHPPLSLRLATLSDPKTFNLIVADETSSTDAVGPLFDSLVEMDPLTLDFKPSLAERWEVSPDGKRWTFTLRKNLVWSDGVPLTSEDVIFTMKVIYNPSVPNSYADILKVNGQPIQFFTPDKRTVEFYLPVPFAPFLHSVGGIPILPEHILEKDLKAGRFASRWNISEDPSSIVASGPYTMVRYEPAQFILYRRNPHYWKYDNNGQPLPYIERRTLLIIPSADTQFLRFTHGDIDIYSPRAEDISRLKKLSRKGKVKIEKTGVAPGITFLTFNRNPRHYVKNGKTDPRLRWFSDRCFLRAVAYSLDKKTMVQNVLLGIGVPAVAFISPANVKYHHPHLKDYDYNPSKAKEILRKCGYVDTNGDGWLEDPEGNRIEFNLFTNAGNQVREKLCSIIMDDLTKLGMKVNFRPLDFNSLVERLVASFDWDAVVIGFTGSVEPHNGANILKSSGKLHIWNPAQEKPATSWEAEIDRLVDEGATTLDEKKRIAIYWKIQEILHRELPVIPLVRQVLYSAYLPRVKNFYPTVWGWHRWEYMTLEP